MEVNRLRRAIRALLTLAAAIVGILASVNAAGACNICFYQPEIPKQLR